MTDVLTREQRSRCMAAIRGKHTKPELIVRSVLHGMGYRFRLHRTDLPGKPDIVLPKSKTLVFVHGCFWHMHRCRLGRVIPATNAQFWQSKRTGNVQRDKRNARKLKADGWRVISVWESWTKQPDELNKRLASLLD